MSKIALSGNASGTGTLTLSAPNTNSDRTLTLPDNSGTLLSNASTFAGTGPAFSAYSNATTTLTSANTAYKIPFQIAEFDTASCYDNATNYRFTPNVAGYYQVTAILGCGAVASNYFQSVVFKNGSRFTDLINFPTSASAGPVLGGGTLMYMNGTTDYIEIYAQSSAAGAVVYGSNVGARTMFQAFLARAA